MLYYGAVRTDESFRSFAPQSSGLAAKLRKGLKLCDGEVAASNGWPEKLLCPGDAGFETSFRIFNRRLQQVPSAVFQPQSSDDVAAVLSMALAAGFPVTVKNGGHSPAGWSVQNGEESDGSVKEGFRASCSHMDGIVLKLFVPWNLFSAGCQEMCNMTFCLLMHLQ